MDRPFAAYKGENPYVFVSYAHADSELVYPELSRLHDSGFDIWYDEGITPAHNWPEELAKAIDGSALFVLFISPNSVQSGHCQREISYAIGHDIRILAIHLVSTELPKGLELEIGNSQAILKYELSDDLYFEKAVETLSEFLPAANRQPEVETPVTESVINADVTNASKLPARNLLFGVVALVIITAGAMVFLSDTSEPEVVAAPPVIVAPTTTFEDIEPLVEKRKYAAAFRKAEGADLEPAQWATFALPGEFKTEPAGAAVSVRALDDEPDNWLRLGNTPTGVIPLPIGVLEVLLEKPGYETLRFALTNPSRTLSSQQYGNIEMNSPVIPLRRDPAEPDMAYIPPGKFVPGISGFAVGELGIMETGAFLMDRYEVTNKAYQAFVDANGYDDPQYWDDMVFESGENTISWEEARAMFIDSTGRTGPATWELGTFPVGEEDHPVAGVSWYEAVAYSRFVGKTLPNIYHWARAAYSTYGGGPLGGGTTLAPDMALNSNFGGSNTVPVGSVNSIGAYGTYDQAGNVREWVFNGIAHGRWLVGGGWDDESYMGSLANGEEPLDRHFSNGFRLSKNIDQVAEVLLQDYNQTTRSPEDYIPIDDNVYDVLVQQFTKSRLPLDAQEVDTDTPIGPALWHKVSLRTGESAERFTLHVLSPPQGEVTGTVVVFPGIGFFMSDQPISPGFLSFLTFMTLDQRAVIIPEFMGSFTRYKGEHRAFWVENSGFERWLTNWYSEMARTVDYIETEPAKYGDQVFYFGISYGAAAALPLVALEPRFRAAIVMMGGVTSYTPLELADAVNYIPRIKIPVLYSVANLDPLFPIKTAQKPFLDLLGTPPEQVRYISYEGGHTGPPRKLLLREVSNFLARYSDSSATLSTP